MPESKKPDNTNGGADTLYSSPSDALKKVTSEFEHWSGKLTETSLQMGYALIGANWVVFGSMNGILGNGWAKTSLLMVILALASNIVGAWILSETLRKRVAYGEGDKSRWKKEFDEFSTTDSPWPFTEGIEQTGRLMRIIKGAFTLLAGAFLIIGAILK
ncbi:MAG TPA: hypothetical protein VI685_03465 [Candidatus Angelobacter sp.]